MSSSGRTLSVRTMTGAEFIVEVCVCGYRPKRRVDCVCVYTYVCVCTCVCMYLCLRACTRLCVCVCPGAFVCAVMMIHENNNQSYTIHVYTRCSQCFCEHCVNLHIEYWLCVCVYSWTGPGSEWCYPRVWRTRWISRWNQASISAAEGQKVFSKSTLPCGFLACNFARVWGPTNSVESEHTAWQDLEKLPAQASFCAKTSS